MKHTISILVKNEAGALSRMVGLFSARGYNIESLTVATTLDDKYANATIVVTDCDDNVVDKILKQLDKLIPVIRVSNSTPKNSYTRELVLIKIDTNADNEALLKVVEAFRAKIIAASSNACTIQAVCDEKQLKSILELLNPMKINEVVRSGAVSILLNNAV